MCESAPITLYLQKQAAGEDWPVDCSLWIRGLEMEMGGGGLG